MDFGNLKFEKLLFCGNYAWGSSCGFNGLFRVRPDCHTAEFMGRFPNEEPFCKRLYANGITVGNKLIFVPMSANEIAVYDTDSTEFMKIPLDEQVAEKGSFYNPRYKFGPATVFKKYVVMVGVSFPAILYLDTETWEVTYETGWVKELDSFITSGKDYYFRLNLAQINNFIILCCCSSNIIMEFNLLTRIHKLYETGSPEDKFNDIFFDGENYILSPKGAGNFLIWNKETNSVKPLFREGFTCPFLSNGIIKYQNKILILPWTDTPVLQVDQNTLSICKEYEKYGITNCLYAGLSEDCLYIITNNDGRWCVFHDDDTDIFHLPIPKEIRKELIKNELVNSLQYEKGEIRYVTENSEFTLELLLETIPHIQGYAYHDLQAPSLSSKMCGEKIYETIKKSLVEIH